MPITSRSVLVCLVVGLVVAVIASSAAALPRFQQTLVLIKPEGTVSIRLSLEMPLAL